MTGDFFRSIQHPNVDLADGGSLQGLIEGVGVVIAHAGRNTIVSGHGPRLTIATRWSRIEIWR